MSEFLPDFPKENIYGHRKRLDYICSHLNSSDVIIEFGCGSGYMISLPLLEGGYNIYGVDSCVNSIAYGKKLLREFGHSEDRLRAADLNDINVNPDVIIASEVLEHIPDKGLNAILKVFHNKISNNGLLLVTVPNGYGWFEVESFFWFRMKIGKLLERLRIIRVISKLKYILLGRKQLHEPASTISNSPHVQRFTYKSIQKLLQKNGFNVVEITGTVLIAGPFSNLFTAVGPIMRLNCKLGSLLPYVASGFMILCRKEETTT